MLNQHRMHYLQSDIVGLEIVEGGIIAKSEVVAISLCHFGIRNRMIGVICRVARRGAVDDGISIDA